METCIRGFSTSFTPENKVEVIPLQVSKISTSRFSTIVFKFIAFIYCFYDYSNIRNLLLLTLLVSYLFTHFWCLKMSREILNKFSDSKMN